VTDNALIQQVNATISKAQAAIESRDAEIARLRKRAERLEAALRPFAALYQPDALCAHSDDQPDSRGVYGINAANITLGDLRRARAVLADGESASG
jgi:hypothetical protein